MRQFSERKIKVKKQQLLDQVEKNKQAHILEYKEAVEAYKEEAEKQIKAAKKALTNGNFNEVYLSLTVPVNKEEEYDKVIEMFKWEVEDIVELSQGEFNQYVFDEFDFAIQARVSNTFYAKSKRL